EGSKLKTEILLSTQHSALSTLDGLASLVDKSLLRPVPGGDELRFGMLETIREFAGEQLAAAGEGAAARRRQAAYFLRLAEEAEPRLTGAGRQGWLARLETEHDNLRAALAWSAEAVARGEAGADLGLRWAWALTWFWFFRGHVSEGRAWVEPALARVTAPLR